MCGVFGLVLQYREEYVEADLLTSLKTFSDVEEMLLIRLQRPSDEENEADILKRNFYAATPRNCRLRNQEKTLGLASARNKRAAFIHAAGAITSGECGTFPAMGATLGPDSLVALPRRERKDNTIATVVIRYDSPGGSALASDIVYHEVRWPREKKPVVA